ncbi:DUF4412 domain-containing protein [Belliella sp. DSM 111904]|uniref:DUF4412 domain-containing protein n=1 Tax=Belliella filtrata TaxID=2923435 RepID=A0ABS9V672_9BACT|nr:DUF4412 domain-containing protein [Belliella filtrata]MCH7411714.1 DUF4412 domain-containing protein [Belliella filtrata]
MKRLTDKLGQKAVNESTDKIKRDQNKNAFEEMLSSEGGLDFSNMLGGASDYVVPESYSFDYQVTMNMSIEKGKPMTQVWKYNTQEGYFGMENSGMLIIYDLGSEVMVTINPKDKSYQTISSKLMGSFSQTAAIDASNNVPSLIETNESKTILGYKAKKYIMEDEEIRGEFWLSADVPFDQSSMAKTISSLSKNKTPIPDNLQGFMMEMKAFDKSAKTTSNMEVIQLGAINEVIVMNQYKNAMAF